MPPERTTGFSFWGDGQSNLQQAEINLMSPEGLISMQHVPHRQATLEFLDMTANATFCKAFGIYFPCASVLEKQYVYLKKQQQQISKVPKYLTFFSDVTFNVRGHRHLHQLLQQQRASAFFFYKKKKAP